MEFLSGIAWGLATWGLPVLLAITLHEAAHGYAARLCGDNTAYYLGRVSLNPLRHVDTFGTIILPGLLLLLKAPFLFGWAKPVPVDFRYLRNFKRDIIIVALAGPLSNLAQMIIAALLLHTIAFLPASMQEFVFLNLQNAILINGILAVFNMLPIPPLDGSKVLMGLLPSPLDAYLARMEKYGMFLLLMLLFVIPFAGRELGFNLSLWPYVLEPGLRALVNFVGMITGL